MRDSKMVGARLERFQINAIRPGATSSFDSPRLAQDIRLAFRQAQCRPTNTVTRMACHERAQRVEWRRGELNSRPKTSIVSASTCLGGVLLSSRMTNTVILHAGSVVFISPGANVKTLWPVRCFRLARRGRPRYTEDAYLIRQPLRGAR